MASPRFTVRSSVRKFAFELFVWVTSLGRLGVGVGRARPSDLKHGILPIGQLLYIWAIFFVADWRIPGGRHFYNPFYGGTEQALFIALFPVYIFFGYEYFRHRRQQSSP